MIEKLTDIINRLKSKPFFKNRRKLIENCIIAVIIGIIIIIAGGALLDKKEAPAQDEGQIKSASVQAGIGIVEDSHVQVNGYSDDMEKELASILSKIKGAGNVSVMITYNTGKEVVAAFDTRNTSSDTQEKDNNGGIRTIIQDESENTVVYEDEQGGLKKALITKEIMPCVKGALIIAGGASDAYVRQEIINAVMVLLDLPIHRIEVSEMKK